MAKFRFAQWLCDWLFALQSFSFEWDAGNSAKSFQKHDVSRREAEEVFLEQRFIPLGEQCQPQPPEARYGILGETRGGKLLFVAFTLRNQRIRVISSRPMNEREKKFYVSLCEE
jgi:uncharacterized protein